MDFECSILMDPEDKRKFDFYIEKSKLLNSNLKHSQ